MAKEYKGFLDEAIKLGANLVRASTTIPNKETYKIGDNYISVGKDLTYEWTLSESDDVHEIDVLMDAYTRAAVEHSIRDQKETKGISSTASQVPATVAVPAAQTGTVPAFGPPSDKLVAEPAKTPSEAENPVPVEVVKFTLARRTDGKYDLGLFQMYGQKVGQFPELKYTAEQAPMWTMIGHLVENLSFDVMPVEYEVSWLAEWTHGREYTKKDNTKGRYKDLVGLKAR